MAVLPQIRLHGFPNPTLSAGGLLSHLSCVTGCDQKLVAVIPGLVLSVIAAFVVPAAAAALVLLLTNEYPSPPRSASLNLHLCFCGMLLLF